MRPALVVEAQPPRAARRSEAGPLLSLPPALRQRIVDAAAPGDALVLGRSCHALREHSARHPALAPAFAWADPALCSTAPMLARRLADMGNEERRAFLRRPYFWSRPVQPTGPPVPWPQGSGEEACERLADSRSLSIEARQALLADCARPAPVRAENAAAPSAFVSLGATLLLAEAPPEAPVRFFGGLHRQRDGWLFAPMGGIGRQGGGRCRISDLLLASRWHDPVRPWLRALTPLALEAQPILTSILWRQVSTQAELLPLALARGLDPLVAGANEDDTLLEVLLQAELEVDDDAELPAGTWPLELLTCWHLLQQAGISLDLPLAGQPEPTTTYREMLSGMHPPLAAALLAPIDAPPLAVLPLRRALVERMRAVERRARRAR